MSSLPLSSRTSDPHPHAASGAGATAWSNPERWVGALHTQEDEPNLLACLVVAALTCAGKSGDPVLVLTRNRDTGELVGAVGGEADGSGERLAGESAGPWHARAEAAWPEWCGRVSSFRLPLTLVGDPAVQACLEGVRQDSTGESSRVSALWSARFDAHELTVWPLHAAGSVAAVLVVLGQVPAESERAGRLAELALHAGLALERLAARRECKIRRAQFATLRESARGLLQGQGLGSALSRLVETACTTMDGVGAALWLVDRRGADIAVAKVYEADGLEVEDTVETALRSLANDVTWRQRALVLDAEEARRRLPPGFGRFAPLLAAPVAGLERPRGALFVYGRKAGSSLGGLPREARELLEVYGLLVGLVVECASEWERAREAGKRLSDLKRERRQLRTAADLGETSVRMAKEMANPIASVLGFARRTRRNLPEGDPQREYLEIVVRETERLERMVEEHLQFASLARSHMSVVNLNRILQDVLSRVQPDIERRHVRLLKRLAPDLPHLVLDPQKIESAIENILRGSLEGVPPSGRLLVQTRGVGEQVLLEVCHDGSPVGGAMDELFAPFATGGRPGAGLGLALAQRVLRDHGGEIGIQSRGDWGHVVTLTLPVTENADRRRPGDRRTGSHRDRRGAWSKR